MRRLTLIAAAGLLSMPVASEAKTLNELLVEKGVISAEEAAASGPARVSYKHGTRLEFPDQGFDMQMNLELKTRYSYFDRDSKQPGNEIGDTSSFNTTLARVNFSGNMLNKQFSYRIENDFISDNSGSTMKDAWFQWNWDDMAKLKVGQFKVPFSRQENVGDPYFQFIDRSDVSNFFSYGRNRGAMVHGDFADAGTYAIGLFNGISNVGGVQEGINAPGVDTDMMGAAQLTYNIGDYGSRSEEGDFRKDGDLAMTMGAAVAYGQGSNPVELTSGSTIAGDFDDTSVNVDFGAKVAGFSLQSEFYYNNFSYNDLDNADLDYYGFYLQTGYMFVPEEWEGAFRFGYINPDQGSLDDREEYSFVVNYFLDGHNLKLQTGISWDVNNLASGDDYTNVRYQTQLAGYF